MSGKISKMVTLSIYSIFSNFVQIIPKQYNLIFEYLLTKSEAFKCLKIDQFNIPLIKLLFNLIFKYSFISIFMHFIQNFIGLYSCQFAIRYQSAHASTILEHFHCALSKNLFYVIITNLVKCKSFLSYAPRKYFSLQFIIGTIEIQPVVESVKQSQVMKLLVLRNWPNGQSNLHLTLFLLLDEIDAKIIQEEHWFGHDQIHILHYEFDKVCRYMIFRRVYSCPSKLTPQNFLFKKQNTEKKLSKGNDKLIDIHKSSEMIFVLRNEFTHLKLLFGCYARVQSLYLFTCLLQFNLLKTVFCQQKRDFNFIVLFICTKKLVLQGFITQGLLLLHLFLFFIKMNIKKIIFQIQTLLFFVFIYLNRLLIIIIFPELHLIQPYIEFQTLSINDWLLNFLAFLNFYIIALSKFSILKIMLYLLKIIMFIVMRPLFAMRPFFFGLFQGIDLVLKWRIQWKRWIRMRDQIWIDLFYMF